MHLIEGSVFVPVGLWGRSIVGVSVQSEPEDNLLPGIKRKLSLVLFHIVAIVKRRYIHFLLYQKLSAILLIELKTRNQKPIVTRL